MLVVEAIGKIRRLHLLKGKSIRSVAGEPGISRNTVRRVVRDGGTEHRYADRERQPRPKPEGYVGEPGGFPGRNAERPRRGRPTLGNIHERLCALGCEAGYDAVRRQSRQWADRQGGGVPRAFVPLESGPGEACRFDWSYGTVRVAGKRVRVRAAQFVPCCSRMPFVRCYPRGTQEMVFDAHDRAFADFGGHCGRGIHPNMTTAVRKVLTGRDREVNPRFLQLCPHCPIRPEFRNVGAGWEKGRAERQVRTLRDALFRPMPEGGTLDEVNEALAERRRRHVPGRPHPDFPEMAVTEVFGRDGRRCLIPRMPPFRGCPPRRTTASKTCPVRSGNNRHSGGARAAGCPVELRAYADRVGIPLDGDRVGSHIRDFGRDRAVYGIEHCPPVLERRPGAVGNGAPFRDSRLPGSLAEVRRRPAALGDGGRGMVNILPSVRGHGPDAVPDACAEALAAGVSGADVIPDILPRRCDPGPAAPIPTGGSPGPSDPPEADCARYDRLPGRGDGRWGGATSWR